MSGLAGNLYGLACEMKYLHKKSSSVALSNSSSINYVYLKRKTIINSIIKHSTKTLNCSHCDFRFVENHTYGHRQSHLINMNQWYGRIKCNYFCKPFLCYISEIARDLKFY